MVGPDVVRVERHELDTGTVAGGDRKDHGVGGVDARRDETVDTDDVAVADGRWRGAMGAGDDHARGRCDVEPERESEHVVDDGRRRSCRAERGERHGGALSGCGGEQFAPTEVEQRGIGFTRSRCGDHRRCETVGEHRQVVGVDRDGRVQTRHDSAPRSSRRRATMLRWISDVPP